ncbi:MAG: hypothetical protein Q9214_005447 [Letrouitia sp. 1 TL-2023]
MIDDDGIDLNAAASRNSIIMRYHLLLPTQLRQGALEIVIKGPYEQEKADSPDHRGFEDACSAAFIKLTSQFRVQNPVQSSAVWSFRSHVPVEGEKIPFSDEERWRPLTNLLYDPDVPIALERTLSFPRSQRIFLAHKFVQCGLLISGTSWLAKLEDKVVKRTPRGPNNAYRFLLELTSDASPLGGSGGAISQHLFAVGILLLELGLGKVMKLHDWRRENGRSYPTLKAYTPTGAEGGDGDIRTPDEWQLLLTITMGDDYTKATKYCLANKRTECWNQVNQRNLMPKQLEQALKEALQEYYINAYLP